MTASVSNGAFDAVDLPGQVEHGLGIRQGDVHLLRTGGREGGQQSHDAKLHRPS